MKFAVPQFIDVEDRIFGALTFKQGIYLGGGAGFLVFLYVVAGIYIAILFGIPVLLFSVALAFFKVHSRPFIMVVESAFFYTLRKKLYLWKKVPKKQRVGSAGDLNHNTTPKSVVPRLTENKLKELAWSLDIKNSSLNES